MTETVKYTRFDGSSLLVADAIYDVGNNVGLIVNTSSNVIDTDVMSIVEDSTSQAITSTISGIVSDVDQDDRVVTEKDKPWSYSESDGYLYTNKMIRAADGMITTEAANSSFFKCDAHKYGLYDVEYVRYDTMFTSYERFIVCSSSSGVWLLTITNGRVCLQHVENSPCCCYVFIDTRSSTHCYIFCANILCFDSYNFTTTYDAITNQPTLTIVSTKNANDGSSAKSWVQTVITDYKNTPTLNCSYDSSRSCSNAVKTVKWDLSHGYESNISSPDTSSKIIVLYTEMGTKNAITFHIFFPLAFSVSASDSPTESDISATSVTDKIVLQVESGDTLYYTSSTRWGALWWSNGTTLSSFINKSSSVSGVSSCPSFFRGDVGTNMSTGGNGPIFYFTTDTFNDYFVGWQTTSSSGSISHAFDADTSKLKWLVNRWDAVYCEHETPTVYGDDVWIYSSTNGIFTCTSQSGTGSYDMKILSPTITQGGENLPFTSIYHIVVESDGTNSYYDYAFDAKNNKLKGLWRLYVGASTSADPSWFEVENWNGKYQACNFYNRINGQAINVAPIKTMIDNNTIIYALTAGDKTTNRYDHGVFVSFDGLNFYKIFGFDHFELAGCSFYKNSLWLTGCDGICNKAICLIDLQLHQLPTHFSNVKHFEIKSDAFVNGDNSHHCRHTDNLIFAYGCNDTFNALNYFDHVIKFNGTITNTSTIDDLTSKINAL